MSYETSEETKSKKQNVVVLCLSIFKVEALEFF